LWDLELDSLILSNLDSELEGKGRPGVVNNEQWASAPDLPGTSYER